MTIKLGYARVSTDKEEGREQTLGQQIDKLTEYGIEPGDIYSEKISGSINLLKGKQWLALQDRVMNSDEPVEIVFVAWNRLSRDAVEFQVVVTRLGKLGHCFTVLGDSRYQRYQVKDAMDGLMLALEAFAAQMHNEHVSKATKAKLDWKKAQGDILGRPKKLTPKDSEAIASLTAKGHGYNFIAQELTKRRVKAIPAEVKMIEAAYVKAVKHATVSKTTVATEVRRQRSLESQLRQPPR